MKSTSTRYGTVAVTIHWASALLILALLVSGMRAGDMAVEASKTAVLSLHIPLGVSVLLLTLARLIWWRMADRKPPSIPMPRWQSLASRGVHLLLYVVILAMASSGIATVALSGAMPIIFGGSPGPLPDFHEFAPRAAHGIGARLMIALFLLHAGAALHHHFIKRDGMLARMWFGKA
jgi:cytochrome b561